MRFALSFLTSRSVAARDQGYLSEAPNMAALRSEMRRDMQMMMRTMVRPEMTQEHQGLYGPVGSTPSYQHMVPSVPQQVAVAVPPSSGGYVLPFIAGCAVSCIGLSYMGLVIYALIRH